MTRKVLFVIHGARSDAFNVARAAAKGLLANNIAVASADADSGQLEIPEVTSASDASGCELVVVFGGDGTILRGIEIAREHDIPVLGVNLGHVGFLAEAEPEDIDAVINTVVNKEWSVEERTALAIHATDADGRTWESWALNEVAIEKYHREHMTQLLVSIDERPVSHWSCDGVLVATPTGSTGYSLSCGGPVVFPDSSSFVITPIAPHNLNIRPIVVPDNNIISFEVESRTDDFICALDSRRVTTGKEVQIAVKKESFDIKLIRMNENNFLQTLREKLSWGLDKRN